jgi:hypothetical protein
MNRILNFSVKLAFLSLLAFPRSIYAAGFRTYYVTTGLFDGKQALHACASGFHMASLWEILNTSDLVYNTQLGLVGDDSGSGPPSAFVTSSPWVRTGSFAAEAGLNDSGISNCNAYTTNDSTFPGTGAALNPHWNTSTSISPWVFGTSFCSQLNHVWCIQDAQGGSRANSK